MEAFFGCPYSAALRPVEAVALREADCVLPKRGRGRIDLAASWPCAGTGWTDDGASREERSLKHRAPGETRSIPIPPVLVTMLRAHIAATAPAPAGAYSVPHAAARRTTRDEVKSGSAPAPSP
jgi:hypothetical protein